VCFDPIAIGALASWQLQGLYSGLQGLHPVLFPRVLTGTFVSNSERLTQTPTQLYSKIRDILSLLATGQGFCFAEADLGVTESASSESPNLEDQKGLKATIQFFFFPEATKTDFPTLNATLTLTLLSTRRRQKVT
jgi:hypothetical protein